jgi:uncharacterized protein (DUF1800 family)
MKRQGLAIALIAVLPAASSPRRQKPPVEAQRDARRFQIKLNKDEQILHALDRLTFGPRPGDVQRVRAIGLKKWIDQQLHPERIKENPYLESRLAPLESLSMTPLETVRHYPAPAMIKAIAEGREALPEDPLLRASIERLIVRYKVRKGESVADAAAELEPVAPLEDVLSSTDLATLNSGTAAKKRELLETLPQERLEQALIAMPRKMRQQLVNDAPTTARRTILLLDSPQQVVAYDLLESKLLRAIYSNRQLAEELDDFWFNHFNVNYDKGADRFDVPSYERDAIRPYVLGKFRDLLEATAKSPAMLFYLDNFESVRSDLDAKAKGKRARRGLNENYGRELMELHTLGVNGGYTQHDVIEVARCFTGWTIEEPRKGGTFLYNDKVHDKGEKVVLGHVIPAGGGIEDGEKVLDILARHPSTAKFVSLELAQRFVSDNPPPALVERMEQTFLQKEGDIREVMKTMLNSREFWSQGAYRAKVKTPFEMAASSVRALDADVENAFPLANRVGGLGEPLYRKQEPTGYSNLNADWVNSAALLARMNFALALTRNQVPGIKVDVARLPQDPQAAATLLLSRNAAASTRAAIEKAAAEQKDKNPALIAGLLIGSPDFQRK